MMHFIIFIVMARRTARLHSSWNGTMVISPVMTWQRIPVRHSHWRQNTCLRLKFISSARTNHNLQMPVVNRIYCVTIIAISSPARNENRILKIQALFVVSQRLARNIDFLARFVDDGNSAKNLSVQIARAALKMPKPFRKSERAKCGENRKSQN